MIYSAHQINKLVKSYWNEEVSRKTFHKNVFSQLRPAVHHRLRDFSFGGPFNIDFAILDITTPYTTVVMAPTHVVDNNVPMITGC